MSLSVTSQTSSGNDGADWIPPSPASVGDVNDPHSNETTFKGKFSVSRRRFGERMGQSFGKEKKSDAEFDDKFKQVMELHCKVEKVKRALQHEKDAAIAMCKSAREIGNACADADVRDVQFQNNQYELDEATIQTLDKSIMRALESITSKCNGFRSLEKRVKTRQKLKLDYDHYSRKVRDLKSKSQKDANRIASNERKLEEARHALHIATLTIYQAFAYYDTLGGRLITPEIEIFKSAQLRFFRASLDIVQICDFHDPALVAKEVEQIGKESMRVPFETGYEPLASLEVPGSRDSYNSHLSGRSEDDTPRSSASNIPPSTAPWMSASSSDIQEPKSPAYSEFKPTAPQTTQAKVLYDYTALDHTEISLAVGETITVEEKHSSGWWTGKKSNGTKGLFPSNYIEVLP